MEKAISINEEFKIKESDYSFRIKRIKPTILLSLPTALGEDFEKNAKIYDFILSNIEVKFDNKWYAVKEGDTYVPADLENDLILMQKLIAKFMGDYLIPSFHKSAK